MANYYNMKHNDEAHYYDGLDRQSSRQTQLPSAFESYPPGVLYFRVGCTHSSPRMIHFAQKYPPGWNISSPRILLWGILYFAAPAPQSGTHSRISSGTRPSVWTVSDDCLKLICWFDTSAFSALEVLTTTALYKFTYLLTYLLTYMCSRRIHLTHLPSRAVG